MDRRDKKSEETRESEAPSTQSSEKPSYMKMDLGPFGEAPRDPSGLDLTIEQVEERIHPGETNVFDK